ncbi:hypothetical protein FRC17_005992 [Serendipita sp. 399]|nr:hypothetical protein FRC17_005992 [Serendipita sp. 399]
MNTPRFHRNATPSSSSNRYSRSASTSGRSTEWLRSPRFAPPTPDGSVSPSPSRSAAPSYRPLDNRENIPPWTTRSEAQQVIYYSLERARTDNSFIKVWGITKITPPMIAAAMVGAKWMVSADRDFTPRGQQTHISYIDLHERYIRLIDGSPNREEILARFTRAVVGRQGWSAHGTTDSDASDHTTTSRLAVDIEMEEYFAQTRAHLNLTQDSADTEVTPTTTEPTIRSPISEDIDPRLTDPEFLDASPVNNRALAQPNFSDTASAQNAPSTQMATIAPSSPLNHGEPSIPSGFSFETDFMVRPQRACKRKPMADEESSDDDDAPPPKKKATKSSEKKSNGTRSKGKGKAAS